MKQFLIFALKPVCYNSYFYFANALAKALAQRGAEIEFFLPNRNLPKPWNALFTGRLTP